MVALELCLGKINWQNPFHIENESGIRLCKKRSGTGMRTAQLQPSAARL